MQIAKSWSQAPWEARLTWCPTLLSSMGASGILFSAPLRNYESRAALYSHGAHWRCQGPTFTPRDPSNNSHCRFQAWGRPLLVRGPSPPSRAVKELAWLMSPPRQPRCYERARVGGSSSVLLSAFSWEACTPAPASYLFKSWYTCRQEAAFVSCCQFWAFSGPKHWLAMKKPISLQSLLKSLVRPGHPGSPSSLRSVEVGERGPRTHVSVWTESFLGCPWACGLPSFVATALAKCQRIS